MSRFLELVDKYQDGEESAPEAEELAALLKDHDGRARTFYDALMLEVDLYESYAGIARIQAAPRRRRRVRQFVLAWAVAAVAVVGLIVLLRIGTPSPQTTVPTDPADRGKGHAVPPEPPPAKRTIREMEDHEKEEHKGRPEHDEHTPGGRRAKIERELDAEIEKARRKGDLKEVEEKLREKERKLKNLDRRGDD